MPDLEYLEYGEESEGDELFGSDNDDLPAAFAQPDTRVPIVPASAPAPNAAAAAAGPGPSQPSSREATPPPAPKPIMTPINRIDKQDPDVRVNTDQRMAQLRQLRPAIPPPPPIGVPSLKELCSMVVRRNAMRIYDIGGLEYSLVAEFLCQCQREQLAEIEKASPHIKKDTDWLWEYFLIDSFPLFYETCRLRKGELRTTGWRRMYEKGAQDAEERQQLARERVANRYRLLEEQRASKRIVVMDTLIAPKANKYGRPTHAASFSSARRGAAASAPYTQQNKMQTAMNKARNESQRARVALTHASGKFVPPPPSARRRPGDEGNLYSNPYAGPSGSGSGSGPNSTSNTPGPGPRIPAPRRPKNLLPGAFPTADGPDSSSSAAAAPPPPPTRRPSTPAHSPGPAALPFAPNAPGTTTAVPMEERFRIDGRGGRELHSIHKPKVENFAARKQLDFFAAAAPMSSSSSPMKRGGSAGAGGSDVKRARAGSASRGQSPEASDTDGTHTPKPAPPAPRRPPPPPKSNKELESVLFAKRRRPPPPFSRRP